MSECKEKDCGQPTTETYPPDCQNPPNGCGAIPVATCPATLPQYQDLCYIQSQIEELFFQYPCYDYYSFNIAESQKKYDDIYGEDLSKTHTKYSIRAYIEVNPSVKMLEKFGIDKRKELAVWLPSSVLEKMALKPRIGDVIVLGFPVYEPVEFVVQEVSRTEYWANTRYPLYTVLTCNRRYLSVITDERVDKDINKPEDPTFYEDKVPTEDNRGPGGGFYG